MCGKNTFWIAHSSVAANAMVKFGQKYEAYLADYYLSTESNQVYDFFEQRVFEL